MAISRKNICVGNNKVVMAGFGLAQIEKYIKKLQENGYTIVVYSQDTQSKNTTRSLNTIFSPGTYFSNDTSNLSNNITCIWIEANGKNFLQQDNISIGISNIDIYTGKTSIFEFNKEFIHNPTTYDELERYMSIYNSNECIFIYNLEDNYIEDIINFVSINSIKIHKFNLNNTNDIINNCKKCEKQVYQQEIIKNFYPNKNDENILEYLHNYCIASQSFVFLLDFVYKHNPNLVNNIMEPIIENYTDRLLLANHSLKQLNIISDNRFSGKYSCVLNHLNSCITSMGKRKFHYDLLNPITNINKLNESYEITEYLLKNQDIWMNLRTMLNEIRDLEKYKRKIILKKISPKDFTIVHKNLECILNIYKTLNKDKTITKYLNKNINTTIKTVYENINTLKKVIEENLDLKISKNIDDITIEKLGNNDIEAILYINRGLSDDIDGLYKKTLDTKEEFFCIKNYLNDILCKYEKNTKTNDYVKIHETSKSDPILLTTKRRSTIIKKYFEDQKNDIVKIEYVSKFTGNNEIYNLNIKDIEFLNYSGSTTNICITSNSIKKMTTFINTSKNNLINKLEEFYNDFVKKVINIELIGIINYVTYLDILQCKSYIAFEYNYCKPEIKDYYKSFINFKGIRHCLIEHLNNKELYVTNDLDIGNQKNPNGILLYGTNAVGKTSIIKSIGIALIMAQAGLYVPASEFIFNPYHCIFTRILGNDNIFKGLSTFAVEMSELRIILKESNKNSLILGDELCSGTESDSALSIFMTGLENLDKNESTFLFATHFHQIVKYDELKLLEKIKLYHMSVLYDNEKKRLIYDRKLKEGPGESMYGLEVCKSLNLPSDFLDRAHELRIKYNENHKSILTKDVSSYNSKKIKDLCEICKENMGTEIHHLQYQMDSKKKNKFIENKNNNFHMNHKANLISICNNCHDEIHRNDYRFKFVKTTDNYELFNI
tara:strand:+ start:1 stop:2838 length:2838 start_codon:yes stop_codon:yes gene_type:complete